jgi:quercetin dioxygenase-like cupin family protein
MKIPLFCGAGGRPWRKYSVFFWLGARRRFPSTETHAYNSASFGGDVMPNKTILMAGALVLAFAGGVYAQQMSAPVQPTPVKRTLIGKVEVPDSKYEVVTAMVEIAPGFKAGRHLHPGIVLGQVLDGEFMLAIDGQPEKVFTAGQTAQVPMRAIHNEGAVGSKPAKLVAIYVVEKDQPLVQPVK